MFAVRQRKKKFKCDVEKYVILNKRFLSLGIPAEYIN